MIIISTTSGRQTTKNAYNRLFLKIYLSEHSDMRGRPLVSAESDSVRGFGARVSRRSGPVPGPTIYGHSVARRVSQGFGESSVSKLRETLLVAASALLAALAPYTAAADEAHYEGRSEYQAPRAATAPVVDGIADDAAWSDAEWRSIENRWLGPEYAADDFEGRFKVVWTEQRIYLLGEFVDDVLIDTHRDPLVQYWDDDCWEIFVDEDYSGGNHQFNHNAFAYHLSLDNKTIDIGTDEQPRDYSHHVESRWQQQGGIIVWEAAIDIYPDTYVDGGANNQPVTLTAGKVMGLMVAYNDNDGSELRENFIGSETVPSGPTDRGWIDASLFGSLVLVDMD